MRRVRAPAALLRQSAIARGLRFSVRGLAAAASAATAPPTPAAAQPVPLDVRWAAARATIEAGAASATPATVAAAHRELYAFFAHVVAESAELRAPSASQDPDDLRRFRARLLEAVLRSWLATALRLGTPLDIKLLNTVLELQARASLPAAKLAFNLLPLFGVAPDAESFRIVVEACLSHHAPAGDLLPYLSSLHIRRLPMPRALRRRDALGRGRKLRAAVGGPPSGTGAAGLCGVVRRLRRHARRGRARRAPLRLRRRRRGGGGARRRRDVGGRLWWR
jgi:hypothetical protein